MNGRDPMPLNPALHIIVDEASGTAVRGWAVDPDAPKMPVRLKFLLDGQTVHEAVCDEYRPDVEASGFGPERVGFSFVLPEHLLDGRRHALSIQSEGGALMRMFVDGYARLEIDIARGSRPVTPKPIFSHIDSFADGLIQGWVLRSVGVPGSGRLMGKVSVAVLRDGGLVSQVVADIDRPDVAASLAGEACCGFRIELPPAILTDRSEKTLRLYVVPELYELEGSPCIIAGTRTRDESSETG